MTTDLVREIEHRMAMARPWDVAEDGSIWEITGRSPDGKFLFDRSLAMALVEPHAAGVEDPARAFGFIPGNSGRWNFIHPAWISWARPLLLVHRDDPTKAYEASQQAWITEATA